MKTATEQLFDFLRDELEIYAKAFQSEAFPTPFVGVDRYVLASLLQKAVRRGDFVIARRAAYELRRFDKPRLWRRLMVTALEDVGIGNLNAAIAMVAASTNAEWRRKLGGDHRVLDGILFAICGGVKDRTSDHLGSIVLHEEPLEGEAATLKAASVPVLHAITASPELPFIYRVRAALISAGRYVGSETLRRGGPKDIVHLLDAVSGMGVPDILVEACRVYARRSNDPLPVLVPCIWMLQSELGGVRQEEGHRLPPSQLLEGVPEYALDPLHTRLGRQAIELWRKSYGERFPWTRQQIAIAVWNYESAASDRTLCWPMATPLRLRAHQADLTGRNLPSGDHDTIMTWVADEARTLYGVRRIVWQRASSIASASQSAPQPVAETCDDQSERCPKMEVGTMLSKEILRLEAGRYRFLADKLKSEFAVIDDETLSDTLEGLSDLPQMIEFIIRSSLEDECLVDALKSRVDAMTARLTRFKERFEKKRDLSCWAMGSAGIDKLEVVDFSVSYCEGAVKIDVTDASKLPEAYLVPVPPKIDRTKLLSALKAGDVIEGASLVKGDGYIAVRVR